MVFRGVIGAVLVGVLVICGDLPAFAGGNSNDNGPENGGVASCQALVQGDETAAVAVCGGLDITVQKTICDSGSLCAVAVEANPSAFCGQFVENEAKAICGDAAAFCGNDAFALAAVKHSCEQAQDVAVETNFACGTQHTSVVCPEPTVCPDVTIKSRTVRCGKIKTLKNGKTIGRHCILVTEKE